MPRVLQARGIVRGHENRRGIRSDRPEGCDPAIEQTCVPPLEVEGQGHEGKDGGGDEKIGQLDEARRDLDQRYASLRRRNGSLILRRPVDIEAILPLTKPPGRRRSTRIMMRKAAIGL